MKRIKWRLTLWWRTLTQGPMCQRCETRHYNDVWGLTICQLETKWTEMASRKLRRSREMWP